MEIGNISVNRMLSELRLALRLGTAFLREATTHDRGREAVLKPCLPQEAAKSTESVGAEA